ncbi:hypothetical protein [Bacillus inaquosorum]|uniref:hypothetical protein n=1 Tax=Bacillus inaquosorum TaxID=483913 RepID=UPI00228002D8|nr:hypothetical protein [Bacillus inaquosorum]MCY7962277.1 hypothetical protein [Bacillus inaquosorum]MEC0519279.1 hypothetical protein [Bacillus inaquosorum]
MKRKAEVNEAIKNNNTPTESMDPNSYKTQYHDDPNFRGANRNSKKGQQGGM